MTTEVLVPLPEGLYRSVERLALNTRQPMSGLLTEVLGEALSAWDENRMPVSALSDQEVLAICDLQMDARQSERLSELLKRQREGELNDDERPELWALMRVYERALVHKSEGLVEAVKRGLRRPLQA
jgi:hypothetical protein